MILQSTKMAWKSIATNKMRSFLTMLGIIIGVVALVVLVSLVSSATTSITDEISSIGSNMLSVTIMDDKGNPMKLDDVTGLTENSTISAAAPVATASLTVSSGDTSETANITGTTGDYSSIQEVTLSTGRFLKNIDVTNHTNVAVISSDIATEIIGSPNPVGQYVNINGAQFMVIGVLEEDDSTYSTDSDYSAYVPYTALIRQTNTVSSSITSFYVSATDETSLDAAESTLETYLNDRFSDDDDAYNIMNSATIMEAMNNITSMLALLLGGIAGISLLVGGIGIMNIMLVSVTERTKEIGIRKAIGATKTDILIQFLIEALMVSLIGALIGIVASFGIIKIIGVIGASSGISFSLSGTAVLVSIAFSLFVGVVFGLYPANKAAKMNPIEALRFQ